METLYYTAQIFDREKQQLLGRYLLEQKINI